MFTSLSCATRESPESSYISNLSLNVRGLGGVSLKKFSTLGDSDSGGFLKNDSLERNTPASLKPSFRKVVQLLMNRSYVPSCCNILPSSLVPEALSKILS